MSTELGWLNRLRENSKHSAWLVQMGAAIQAVGSASASFPDVEIRIQDGRITLWRDGEEAAFVAGTRGVEPDADNWLWIATHIGSVR